MEPTREPAWGRKPCPRISLPISCPFHPRSLCVGSKPRCPRRPRTSSPRPLSQPQPQGVPSETPGDQPLECLYKTALSSSLVPIFEPNEGRAQARPSRKRGGGPAPSGITLCLCPLGTSSRRVAAVPSLRCGLTLHTCAPHSCWEIEGGGQDPSSGPQTHLASNASSAAPPWTDDSTPFSLRFLTWTQALPCARPGCGGTSKVMTPGWPSSPCGDPWSRQH